MPRTSRSVAQRLAAQQSAKSKKRRAPRSTEAAPATSEGERRADLDEVVPSEGGSRTDSTPVRSEAAPAPPTAAPTASSARTVSRRAGCVRSRCIQTVRACGHRTPSVSGVRRGVPVRLDRSSAYHHRGCRPDRTADRSVVRHQVDLGGRCPSGPARCPTSPVQREGNTWALGPLRLDTQIEPTRLVRARTALLVSSLRAGEEWRARSPRAVAGNARGAVPTGTTPLAFAIRNLLVGLLAIRPLRISTGG